MGIIETIAADVAAIKAMLGAQAVAVAPQPVPVAPQVAPVAPVDPLAVGGAPVAPQPVHPTVSAEQITALITPHVADPNLKAALQQQMAAMGIGALPDAQPHQYGELYTRFTTVIQQFQAAAAAQPVAAVASII